MDFEPFMMMLRRFITLLAGYRGVILAISRFWKVSGASQVVRGGFRGFTAPFQEDYDDLQYISETVQVLSWGFGGSLEDFEV